MREYLVCLDYLEHLERPDYLNYLEHLEHLGHLKKKLSIKQYAQEVCAPKFAEVVIRETFCLEAARKVDHIGRRSETGHTAIAIEVATDAYVVNTCDVDHVKDVTHGIFYRCALRISEKTGVERSLRHTTLTGEGTELIVGEVTRVIAKGACRRMRESYGVRTAR